LDHGLDPARSRGVRLSYSQVTRDSIMYRRTWYRAQSAGIDRSNSPQGKASDGLVEHGALLLLLML